MNDQLDTNAGSNQATGNDDASHEGVNMDTGLVNQSNHTESAEVSGTKPVTYEVAIRKAAGIKRTNDPIKLRNLRDMADAVVVGLKAAALEKTELAANTTVSLDALALKAEVTELEKRVAKMAKLKDAINARVEVLLKG